MKIIARRLLILSTFLYSTTGYSQDEKFQHAIISKKDVPTYILPDLLTSFNGKKVASMQEWSKVRQPEIMNFFAENLYGKQPIPSESIKKSFTVLEEDKTFMDGLCTKKKIMVTFSNSKVSVNMQMVTFLPNNIQKFVPVIYHVNQHGVKNGEYDYWADPKGAWISALNEPLFIKCMDKQLALNLYNQQ